MKISKNEYLKAVSEMSPPSPIAKNCLHAFLTGGFICAFGQVLLTLYRCLPMRLEDAKTLVSVSLIFITAVLTAVGVFDKIAKYAGAGTVVPITGFANSMVSPAIEYKAEGFVLGVGVKMFTIAGPVIVYGIAASTVYGVVYWLLGQP